MMKTEAVPATESVSDKVATYYVVPIIAEKSSTQNVLYYEESLIVDSWLSVDADKLNARGQGRNAGMIKLHQPSVETIMRCTGLPPTVIDQTAKLYAGVARTLAVSDELGGVYTVGPEGAMIIPVLEKTVRGLILVFTQSAESGKEPSTVIRLIGSTDPEIKNSTGGF